MSSRLKMKYLLPYSLRFALIILEMQIPAREKNPKVTVRKFARYTLPKMIEEILKSHQPVH